MCACAFPVIYLVQHADQRQLGRLQEKFILPFSCRGPPEPAGAGGGGAPGAWPVWKLVPALLGPWRRLPDPDEDAPRAWPVWQLATSVPPLSPPGAMPDPKPLKMTLEQISGYAQKCICGQLPLRLLMPSHPEPGLREAARQVLFDHAVLRQEEDGVLRQEKVLRHEEDLSRLTRMVCTFVYCHLFSQPDPKAPWLSGEPRRALEALLLLLSLIIDY